MPGALNQFSSIRNDVGSSWAGLQSELDSVSADCCWSGSEPGASFAWLCRTGLGVQITDGKVDALFAVRVRSGG